MVRKAKAGHVTGGRVFWYNNVRVDGSRRTRECRVQYGGFGDEGALGMSNARVLPYGFIALGWYGPGGQLADDLDFPSERRIGFNAGFGINIRVNDNFGSQGDVHLHGVSLDDDLDTDYWLAPQGGIWVSF